MCEWSNIFPIELLVEGRMGKRNQRGSGMLKGTLDMMILRTPSVRMRTGTRIELVMGDEAQG